MPVSLKAKSSYVSTLAFILSGCMTLAGLREREPDRTATFAVPRIELARCVPRGLEHDVRGPFGNRVFNTIVVSEDPDGRTTRVNSAEEGWVGEVALIDDDSRPANTRVELRSRFVPSIDLSIWSVVEQCARDPRTRW